MSSGSWSNVLPISPAHPWIILTPLRTPAFTVGLAEFRPLLSAAEPPAWHSLI